MTIDTLGLASKPVTKKTADEISQYIRDNFKTIDVELMTFYDLVAGLIKIQLRKPKERRMDMAQILERSFNFEKNLIEQGAVSFEAIKLHS